MLMGSVGGWVGVTCNVAQRAFRAHWDLSNE